MFSPYTKCLWKTVKIEKCLNNVCLCDYLVRLVPVWLDNTYMTRLLPYRLENCLCD